MFKFKIVLIILSLIFSYSCSKETKNTKLIKETNQKIEMISAYEKGMELKKICEKRLKEAKLRIENIKNEKIETDDN